MHDHSNDPKTVVTFLRGQGVPENATGISRVQDEKGNELIRMGFVTDREIIREIGFDAHPDLAPAYQQAMEALIKVAAEKKTMEA